ncbi:hypothetical protein FisN_21Hh234 [Fistulifera solaris]|uniref:Uncharacterized protein n=1 Tax=Fistulifera solaris TaxID=1519565 RepID=A0A1Z5JSC5_FISSO|nr:hypothetical protein FisN_21Hh234 [Fistulifera solaris]|eukprot:GAX16786.1 hypothetical protein FisN_21Hh234 [Fistulifera solaris]
MFRIIFALVVSALCFSPGRAFTPRRPGRHTHIRLFASSLLKPAAVPLMDAGKAVARSGELIIELTTAENIYGGALSAVGAQVRNAGDCLAQAAASCRFKTGSELVTDELREAATCLQEAVAKMELGAQEALVDNRNEMASSMEQSVSVLASCGQALESAGAGIMTHEPVDKIGTYLVDASKQLLLFSQLTLQLAPNREEAQVASQRLTFAAERMKIAGNELQGIQPAKKTGKSWLKGGSL